MTSAYLLSIWQHATLHGVSRQGTSTEEVEYSLVVKAVNIDDYRLRRT